MRGAPFRRQVLKCAKIPLSCVELLLALLAGCLRAQDIHFIRRRRSHKIGTRQIIFFFYSQFALIFIVLSTFYSKKNLPATNKKKLISYLKTTLRQLYIITTFNHSRRYYIIYIYTPHRRCAQNWNLKCDKCALYYPICCITAHCPLRARENTGRRTVLLLYILLNSSSLVKSAFTIIV